MPKIGLQALEAAKEGQSERAAAYALKAEQELGRQVEKVRVFWVDSRHVCSKAGWFVCGLFGRLERQRLERISLL